MREMNVRPVAYAAAMNAIQQELPLPRWGRAPVDQTKVETALVRVAPGERLLDVAKALKLGASTIRRECRARAAAPGLADLSDWPSSQAVWQEGLMAWSKEQLRRILRLYAVRGR